ncbi:MAG: hypothetical protein ACUVQS_02910 [Candidatus Bipolaricaulaceae bacterium]
MQAWPIVYRGQPAVQGIRRNVTVEAETERLRKGLLAATKEILSASRIEEVPQGIANVVVQYSPFRRAVVSLYDLRHDSPLLGAVIALATAGLAPEEEEKLRTQGALPPEMLILAFQEKFRLSRCYYIPHDQVP